MRTLYCYKFNDVTGDITKIEITEYRTLTNKWSGCATYQWGTPKINASDSHFAVVQDKLDRFVSNKVFTFRNDDEYAYKIIENTLEKSIKDLKLQMFRKQALLKIFHDGQARRSYRSSIETT